MLKNLGFCKEVKFLYLSFFLFAVAVGMDLVIFPAVLHENKIDAATIGICYTLELIGGILMSFFLSRIVAKFGAMRSLQIAGIAYATSISLIYFYVNFFVWAAFAFFMGSCWLIYAITRQSWLNLLLKNEQRGIGLGIFSTILSLGIAVGPMIVKYSGATNYISFLISAALVITSFLALLPLKKLGEPKLSARKIALREFFRNNPRSFLGRFCLDFQTYLLLTFSVIFGVSIGLSYESAGLLLTAYMVSGFFDVFVGFWLKRISAYKLIKIGFLGCLTCFLSIIFYQKSYLILLFTYFVFGLFIACVYVSVFKVMNEDYRKNESVSANATFQLIGYLGAIFGSLIGGFLIKVLGKNGFPIAMVSGCFPYILYCAFYAKNKN